MRRFERVYAAGMLSILAMISGCRSSTPPTVTAPMVSAAQPQRFELPSAGITFMYPAGWKTITGGKSQLQLSNGSSEFTLDVPTLPFHIPGMIPIDAVRSGYVDDAKKRIPDLVQTNLPDPTVPDARQRRVKLTGHQNGKPAIDESVQIVHNDKVYILAIHCDRAGYPAAKAALDEAVQSLQWTN